MGEARRRAAAQDMISVLIPERGRPNELERLIASLIDTAGDGAQIEILVAIDDDDEAWADSDVLLIAPNLRVFRWPRPITLGEKLNALFAEARGSLIWFLSNDTIVTTPGWPGRFRAASARLPNGIGVMSPRDALHPGHASYFALTRRMVDSVGFFAPPWFPYWWLDSWWSDIGFMAGQLHEVDIEVRHPDGRGRCHGIADVTWWAEFYRETHALRYRDANNLAGIAHGRDTAAHKEVLQQLPMRGLECLRRVAHQSPPEFAREWEARADSPPGPRYAEAKANAQALLDDIRKHAPRRLRVAICCPSGREWCASTGNSIAAMAAFSASAGLELVLLNVQSSAIAHGRNTSVELALNNGADYVFFVDSDMTFPANTLLRLIQHGEDIVGATYCKRVMDVSGKYPTLGKLVPPKDGILHDGLHEAILLPAGVLLINSNVFRKMGPPWFMEAYRFPGADRLDAFKRLMAAYFYVEPPAEVLSSLDGTKFGAWIAAFGEVGEGGESVQTFSEDLWFVRRARRCGFVAKCDLRLTGEVCHLGEISVSCKMGPEIVRMAAE